MNNTYSRTTCLLLCALFAALTGVFSAISIPLPFTPVPVNLATMAVFLSGGFLGYRYGPLSQLVYVLLGAVGVPVFHSLTGGIGILAGPTGGYIFGYIAASFVIGLMLHKSKKQRSIAIMAGAMCVGAVTYFTLGTAWFMILTHTGLVPSLVACVVPFIPGDILKIIAACLIIKKIPAVVTSPVKDQNAS